MRSVIALTVRRILVTAVLSAATALGAAGAASAAQETLDSLFVRILINPTDVDLNLRYARLAEKQGLIRKALATYERILLQDPNHEEAKAGFQRIRRDLEPGSTVWTLSLGGRYETNPRQLSKSVSRPDDFTAFGKVKLYDERKTDLGRWRTEAAVLGDLHADISDLDFLHVNGLTGPVFNVGNNLRVHTALGGSYALLDGRDLYSEAAFKLGFEGILEGALDKLDVRVAYRDIDKRFSDADGLVVDVIGRVSRSNIFAPSDVVVFYPRFRFSDSIDGNGNTGTIPARLYPGEYLQGGAYAAYYIPVVDNVIFGTTFNAYYRDYDQDIVGGGKERNDTFIAPGAQFIFKEVLGHNSNIKLEYRFEKNFSNDNTEDFENHVIGIRTTRKF